MKERENFKQLQAEANQKKICKNDRGKIKLFNGEQK